MRLAFRALGGAAGVAWRESFPLGGGPGARSLVRLSARGAGGGGGPGADLSPEPQQVPSATLLPQASVSTSESTETYFSESCFEHSMKWW